MARQEYDPRVMQILIEDSAKKAELKTQSTDLIRLSSVVSSALDIEEGKSGFIAEKYIDSLYRDCKGAIRKDETITKESSIVDTLINYVGAQSFEGYQESHAEDLLKFSELLTEDHSAKNFDGRPGKPFDMYDLLARQVPGIISLSPLIVMLVFSIVLGLEKNRISPMALVAIVSLTMVAFVFFILMFSNLTAGLSKIYQNKYFIKVNGFPTTYLMLYQNPVFSDDYKKLYREKIHKLFKLKPLTYDEEIDNKVKSIQWLNSSTEYVKQFVYKGLIRTQNIRYGFIRNLIGATFFGIPFSIMGGVTGLLINSIALTIVSVVLLILFLFVQIFKKHMLLESAEAYAKELFANFLR